MKKVITIGSALQDVIIYAKGNGEKKEVTHIVHTFGGGALNAAFAFNLLEYSVSPLCKIGTDEAGNTLLTMLKTHSIDTSLIVQDAHEQTGISFIIPDHHRNTILSYRAASALLSPENIPEILLKKCDLIYIAPLTGDAEKVLSKVVTHKKNSCFLAVNPASSQLTPAFLNYLHSITLFSLNKEEAFLFLQKLGAPPCFTTYFKIMHAQGVKIAIITDGNKGIHVSADNNYTFYPNPSSLIIQTVGAGDLFTATLAGLLNQGLPLKEAVFSSMKRLPSALEYKNTCFTPQLPIKTPEFIL